MNGDRPPNAFRFPPSARLKKPAEFEAVFASRRVLVDAVLVISAGANGLSWTRLGLSIGRVVGSAVVRNRWKRLIREAFRLQRASLPAGWDLVIRPRRGSQPELPAILHSLSSLTRKLARSPQGHPRASRPSTQPGPRARSGPIPHGDS